MKKVSDGILASESRRKLLTGVAGAGVLSALGATRVLAGEVGSSAELGFAELPDGTLSEQMLYALPGKLPLIKKTYRPPNFETPINYFRTPVTPNNAFFVRYHIANIPEVKAADWTLTVGGESAEREVKLTLNQLRKEFKSADIMAVCQCSGNRRGLFEPHVAGVEWGVGAMGNALWRGVRLKDVLDKAGIKSDALEVVFDGADHAVLDKTPDFVKALPIEVALLGSDGFRARYVDRIEGDVVRPVHGLQLLPCRHRLRDDRSVHRPAVGVAEGHPRGVPGRVPGR